MSIQEYQLSEKVRNKLNDSNEKNVDALEKVTFTNTNLHFSYANGSDETGDGTSQKPYKDIQVFLNKLQYKVLTQGITLILLDSPSGGNSIIYINFIYGQSIIIRGNTLVGGINVSYCECDVYVQDFTLSTGGLKAIDTNYVSCYTLNTDSTNPPSYGIVFGNTNGDIANCKLQYCTSAAVIANNNSNVFVRHCDGTNNNVAYMSYVGSVLRVFDCNVSGNTQIIESNGGLVVI